jgi:PAS domain S-box-containing protein
MTTENAEARSPNVPEGAPSGPGEAGGAVRDVGAQAPLAGPDLSGALAWALFEQSPLSTVVYRPDGRPTAVNAAFERLWGTSLAHVPAGYSVLADAQLEAAGIQPLVRRAFSGEAVSTPAVRYDVAEVAGEGRTTWTQGHFYPVLSGSGELAAVVLVHVDLTERMQAEEALRAEQERLRVALEAGEMGTWEWNVATGRVTWSEGLQRIHGLRPGTFGGTFDDYRRDIHPEDAERVLAAVARTMDGAEHRLAYRIVRPDGQVRWLEARGVLFRDGQGRPQKLLGICSDVTERRRALENASFLADAGRALNASLNVEATLRTVASLALPRLGDYCLLDVREAAGVRRVAAAAPGAPHAADAARMEAYPPDLERGTNPIARVILSGQAQLIDRWKEQIGDTAARTDEHAALIRALGVQSVLIVPLTWNDETVGALSFVHSGERRHDASDLALAEDLARRAAAAVANARLHREATDARDLLEHQALELELQTQQLQEQAAEMESQQQEMEQQVEEMATLNEELASANQALLEAEGFVRGVLESISDPFVVHDAGWRFRYVNEAAAAVFRTSGHGGPERLVGRVVWDEYPDLVGSRVEREMRRAAEQHQPVSFEEFSPRTGTWSEMRCYPLPGGGLATVWKDVTARRRSEEAAHFLSGASAILGSSLDYEATLSAVAQMLVPRLGDWCVVQLVDPDGRVGQVAVAHADPARLELARELNRRFPPNPGGDAVLRGVLTSGRGAVVADIPDEMLAAGARGPEHLRMVRELGLRSAIVAPLTARGRVLGAITLISAESERRYGPDDLALATEIGGRAGLAVDNARLYAEAAAARADAEAANRAKSEFLAVMSHELRTPLNAIGGYAELIELGVHGDVTPAQAEALSRIQRSQRHLLSLINDVLNYARIEAARVHYDLAPVPLHEALAGLEALLAPQVRARGVSYAYTVAGPALAVMGDEEKVRQVLLNLLSNAVKFTAPGGRVWVSAEADADAVRIHVADTGTGIPSDKLDSVFEPFVQLGRGLSSTQEGTGLGLAISRDLARGMGGDLTAQSVVGEGSTFTLRLPRAPDVQATPDP